MKNNPQYYWVRVPTDETNKILPAEKMDEAGFCWCVLGHRFLMTNDQVEVLGKLVSFEIK